MSNGLTYDRQGRLLTCEHATSRVTRTEADGRIVPLATHYQGKELNSPNDIVCKGDGGIYFTDPPYGRLKFYGVERPQELIVPGRVPGGRRSQEPGAARRRLRAAQRAVLLAGRARLFVNDTARKHIRVFDVTAAGTLSNGRLWAETKGDKPGAPDGMKIDAAGNGVLLRARRHPRVRPHAGACARLSRFLSTPRTLRGVTTISDRCSSPPHVRSTVSGSRLPDGRPS